MNKRSKACGASSQQFTSRPLLLDLQASTHLMIRALQHTLLLPVYLIREGLSVPIAVAEAIVRFLEDSGPFYVKFGQVMSTRSSRIWPALRSRLTRLQDHVRPICPQHLREHLEWSLGKPISEVFAEFDYNPIAAGSIAQIHEAVLHNHERVAVKVRRPDAHREIIDALSVFRRLAVVLSRTPGFRRSPIVESFDNFGTALLQQCDLRLEAEMNAQLRGVFRANARVRLPRIYCDLYSEAALVMEYIPDLVKVVDLNKPDWLEDSIKTGFRVLFKMIFDAGIIHCDFHAGNVFFMPNGRITILDTGFMERLSPQEAFYFRQFFLGIYRGDGNTCAQILLDTASEVSENCNRDMFTNQVSALVQQHSRAAAAEFNLPQFSFCLFAAQRKHGIRGSHRFNLAILSLLVFEGMATEYVPDMDFQREALAALGPFVVWQSF